MNVHSKKLDEYLLLHIRTKPSFFIKSKVNWYLELEHHSTRDKWKITILALAPRGYINGLLNPVVTINNYISSPNFAILRQALVYGADLVGPNAKMYIISVISMQNKF